MLPKQRSLLLQFKSATSIREESSVAEKEAEGFVSVSSQATELDELSGPITGRLGYTWPTTAYAIGGTETLALRYSIISASTAARTRPQ